MVVHAVAHLFADGDLAGGLAQPVGHRPAAARVCRRGRLLGRLAASGRRHGLSRRIWRARCGWPRGSIATPVRCGARWAGAAATRCTRRRLLARDGWGRERRKAAAARFLRPLALDPDAAAAAGAASVDQGAEVAACRRSNRMQRSRLNSSEAAVSSATSTGSGSSASDQTRVRLRAAPAPGSVRQNGRSARWRQAAAAGGRRSRTMTATHGIAAARAVSVSVIESPTKAARPPPARRDRLEQRRRIGLAHGQRIAADERGEASVPAERRRPACGSATSSLLVQMASRTPHAGQLVERGLEPVERARAVGDMRLIIFEEQREAGLDQRLGAIARWRRAPSGATRGRRGRPCGAPIPPAPAARPRRPSAWFSAAVRSGAVSASVPSRSKATTSKGKRLMLRRLPRTIWQRQARRGKGPPCRRAPLRRRDPRRRKGDADEIRSPQGAPPDRRAADDRPSARRGRSRSGRRPRWSSSAAGASRWSGW